MTSVKFGTLIHHEIWLSSYDFCEIRYTNTPRNLAEQLWLLWNSVPRISCLHYCRKWNFSLFFLSFSSDMCKIHTGDVLRCRDSHTAFKGVSSLSVIIVRFGRNLAEASCTKCYVDKRPDHSYHPDNMNEFSPLCLCHKNFNTGMLISP